MDVHPSQNINNNNNNKTFSQVESWLVVVDLLFLDLNLQEMTWKETVYFVFSEIKM